MKVKELIEILKEFDQEKDVMLSQEAYPWHLRKEKVTELEKRVYIDCDL